MQPIAITRQAAASLLFVRNSVDLDRALREVNEVLSYRPRHASQGEEVLAIIGCDDVDSGPLVAGHTDPVAPTGDLVVRESLGLSGIWNLCCFDITIRRHPVTPELRRMRLLDALQREAERGSSEATVATRPARVRVFPVFTPSEVRDDVEGLVDDLAARYPRLHVEPRAFLHDPARPGLVPWVLRTAPLENVQKPRATGTSSAAPRWTMRPHLGTEATDETF